MSFYTNDQESTCFVIGNGPSLRGFDFRRLSGFATIGMNAAYRYWREIGWYPTYYACLDDELIATHWRQIIELVREGKVKKAFVSGSIYEHDPSIASDERFVSFDQFAIHWHIHRGKAMGVPFIDSPFFKSSQDSKVTTGSHSVRFAAHLGYKTICLLGIDLKYVEKIPEAEQTGEISLRIRETPKHNPNYFFDGYQQAGDRYNIPNPSEHDGDLHLASLKTVRDDFARTATAPRIINCNSQSRLFEERVFPYQHVDRALNDRPLSAVVVPTILKERDALLNQLWLCDQKDFAPEPSDKFLKPALTYVFNSGDSSRLEEEITATFNASSRLKEAFEAPTFQNIGLSGEKDQYIKDYSKPAGQFGYKAGPNNQFFETLARHAGSTHYLFLMETDCLPIRAGWLNQLQLQLYHAEPFWIMGSGYRGRNTLGESYKRHINGNAVYAAGDVVFQHFIETFWRPELERVVRANPRIAYDCALEILMEEARSDDPDNPTWRLTQEMLHLIRYTDMIHNRSGGRDSWDTPPNLPAQLYREDPVAYFLHGKPFADGLATMRKSGLADIEKWKVPRDESFLIPGSSVIRAPTISQSEEFPRILVLDHTLIGDKSATGELKASLFKEWPKSQYMQVHGGNSSIVGFHRLAGDTRVDVAVPDQRIWLKTKIDDFKPEVIFYRPVPDTLPLHDFAMEVIHAYDVPLIPWIMDDWPKSLEGRDKAQFDKLDQDWRRLLAQSAGALSIGEAMSRAFEQRYRTKFQPFANAIDPSQWTSQPPADRSGILLRYSGSLSPNMGLESIFQVAHAVEQLGREGVDIRFEIKTRQHWLEAAGARFGELTRTTITTEDFSAEEYRSWLAGADIVLIAYNFDEASKDYVRYSIANKLPECLASGAVLVAIGPGDIATMRLLDSLACSITVKSPEGDQILVALRDISSSREKRRELSQRARKIASERFNIRKVRAEFMAWVRDTLRASYVNPMLKITRNAERRRWALRHQSAAQADQAQTVVAAAPAAKPSAPFDSNAFIRPVQVTAPVAAPASASAGGAEIASVVTATPTSTSPVASMPAGPSGSASVGSPPTSAPAGSQRPSVASSALTIFPIVPAGGAPILLNGGSSSPMLVPSHREATQTMTSGVPLSAGEPKATVAATSATKPGPSSTFSHRNVSSVAARLFASRTSKAVAALAALAGLAVCLLLVWPATPEARLAWGTVVGLGILAVGGAYFARRTFSFARRTASENVDIKEKLAQAAARLATLERDLRMAASQQNANTNAIAQRIERQMATSLAALEQRLAALDTLPAELTSLRDEQGTIKTSVQALSVQHGKAAADIGTLREQHAAAVRDEARRQESLAASLAELRQQQADNASRVADSIDGVSGRVSELAARVDTETARADDLRLDLSQAREAIESLDALARDGLAEASDRLSALRETAFLDAENRRQIEERLAMLEVLADDTTASLSRSLEEARSAADRAMSEAGLARVGLHELDVRTVAEASRLSERVASIDDFAKQVASELRLADDGLKQSFKAIDAQHQTLGDGIAMLRTEMAQGAEAISGLQSRQAEIASQLPLMSERLAAVDDFTKHVASDLRLADDELKESLRTVDAQLRALGEGMSMLRTEMAQGADVISGLLNRQAEIASQLPLMSERLAAVDDFAKQVASNVSIVGEDMRQQMGEQAQSRAELASAIAALDAELAAGRAASDARIRDIEKQVPLLAERIAFADDFAKALYCDAQIAEETTRKVASELGGLSSRITLANEGVGRVANSHAELRMIVADLRQSFAADHTLLSEFGPQLAEIAGLSEQVVAETTAALRGVEAKLAGSEARLASSLANLIARADGVDEKVRVSALKLEDDIAKAVERLGAIDGNLASKADRKTLDDLILRMAELAELSESVAGETAGKLGAITSHVTALAAESAALRDRISMLAVSVGEKADSAELGALERRLVDVSVTQTAEKLAAFGRQVSTVETQLRGVEEGLEKVETGLIHRLSEIEAEAERRVEAGARESEKSRAIISGEMAVVGARVSELEGNLLRHVSELDGTIKAFDGESRKAHDGLSDQLISVGKQLTAVNDELARHVAGLAATIDLRVEEWWRDSESAKAVLVRVGQTEQGLSTIAGIQRDLVDAVDKIQIDTRESGEFRIATGKQIADLVQRLQAADAKGMATVEEIRAKLQDMSNLQEQLKDLDGRLANETKQRFAYTTRSTSAQEEVASKLIEIERAIADLAETAAKRTGLTEGHIQAVSGKVAVVERGLDELAKSAGHIKVLEDIAKAEREKVAEISARLNEAKQRIETTERTSMFDNASWYQRFNRRLQQQHIQVLEKEWTRKLSVQGSRATFGYMAARVSEIERELDGRLATTVEDVILRTLVAQATRGSSVSVLEIGTLFGIGAAIMFDTLKNHFDDVHFTLLDPLEGYYAGGRPDILTGQPVTQKVVRRNMARIGMREDQLRLITRLSTEEEAIEEASERLYDVLVIDADHSYAGVKTDFENFGRMVKLGGYIIFDDYGSEDWPDVKAYVDAEIPSADFLAHVGNTWRTSVYRVVKPPPASRRTRPRAGQKPRPAQRKTSSTTGGE